MYENRQPYSTECMQERSCSNMYGDHGVVALAIVVMVVALGNLINIIHVPVCVSEVMNADIQNK